MGHGSGGGGRRNGCVRGRRDAVGVAAVVVAAVRFAGGVVRFLGVVVDGGIQTDDFPPTTLTLLVAMVAVVAVVVAGAGKNGVGGSTVGGGDPVVATSSGCEDCRGGGPILRGVKAGIRGGVRNRKRHSIDGAGLILFVCFVCFVSLLAR